MTDRRPQMAEGAIAFGTLFLANPDLPNRFAQNAPLNAPEPSKFYSPEAEGYTPHSARQKVALCET